MSNSLIPFFGVTAGITDAALLVVVLGTMAVALLAHVLALAGWLRRRP
jgi:tetrahydromethanopterin S-methyltransferase subunit B